METPVGTSGAEKAAPESTAVKSASPESGANGSDKKSGLDGRIDELTGELARKNDLLTKLREENKALADKLKTEDEKRMDELLQAKYGPELADARETKEWLMAERDTLMKQIPATHQGLVVTGENITLRQQLTQMRNILALSQKGSLQPFNSGGNPASETKRMYTKAEYQKWSQSSSGDAKNREYYETHRDEMQAAIREGRVEGLR